MPSVSSIFSMYSGVNSATHHIFFPPRLQLVALQQNPDCFSPHLGHQLTFDGLFYYQAHRPPRPPFRRLTANHGNDPLFLGIVEDLLGSWPLLVVEGDLQAATVVPMGDLTDRLGSQGKRLCDLRRRESVAKLAKHQCANDNTHLLNASSQQFNNLDTILRLDFDWDRATRHGLSIT